MMVDQEGNLIYTNEAKVMVENPPIHIPANGGEIEDLMPLDFPALNLDDHFPPLLVFSPLLTI